MAALHGIAADEAQLRHQHGREPFDLQRLLLAAQQLGLNARAVRQDPRRLARAPLPAVARDAAGRFFVVARIEGTAALPAGTELPGSTRVLIQRAGEPPAVIALEELAQGGVRQLLRVGSAGSLQAQVGVGDLVVVEAAVRHDGASLAYLPAEYPACADLALQSALIDAIRSCNHPLHHGLIRSHDAFYRDDEQEVCALWHRRGILAADMESGALLAVGRYRGVRVASVLCNVVAFEQDVQEGVSDYAASEAAMMTGERLAIAAALHALTQ